MLKHYCVEVTRDPPCAAITLRRPEARNALSHELIFDLRTALNQLAEDSRVSVIILTGQGKAFCAGADLKWLAAQLKGEPQAGRRHARQLADLYQQIFDFPKPVIAAVNGPALGGGCGLATCCDLVVASQEAIFGYPEVTIGFVPALVSVFLLRTCAEKKAMELLLTGRSISAREACELGLVNEVVPPELVLTRSQELASRIAANSLEAVQLTRFLIKKLGPFGLHSKLSIAAEVNALARTLPDFRKGIEALLKKGRKSGSGEIP